MSSELRFEEGAFNPPSLESLKLADKQNRRRLGTRVFSLLRVRKPLPENADSSTLEVKEAVTDGLESYRSEWMERVHQGVAEDWLDRSALDRAPNITDLKINIVPAGTLLTEDTAGQVDLAGNLSIVEGHEHALPHEFNHALLAGNSMLEANASHIKFRRFIGPWINEALTEHISETMNGNAAPQTLNTGSGEYLIERTLLKELLARSENPDGPDKDAPYHGTSLKDLTKDYSADMYPGTDKVEAFKELTLDITRMMSHNDTADITPEERTASEWHTMIELIGLLRYNPELSIDQLLPDQGKADISALLSGIK